MPEHHNVFVSYATIDNEPLPGVENGWITELIRGLKRILEGQLGRRDRLDLWMDYELPGNQGITPAITTALLNSDTILLILSPAYIASDWCQRELKAFIDQHQIDTGRIFMVELEPLTKPESLSDLKGYRFYHQTQEDKLIKYGWPAPDPKQLAYYQKTDDLGRDIARKIQQIEAERTAQTTAELIPEHTVLLAPVTDDLRQQREQMQRFLQQQNIRVLPETGEYALAAISQQLPADLAQAELYVQLLSEDTGMGIPLVLHQTAQQAKGTTPILLWHSTDLDNTRLSDEAHLKLLQDESLIAADLIELQHIIQRHLQPQAEAVPRPGEDIFLFVNHAPEDKTNLQPLLDELEQRGIGYILPLSGDEGGSPAELREDLIHNILECDALLMLYYDAPVKWVREQLMLWRKTAIKRQHPPRGLGICKDLTAKLTMRLPGLQLVDCEGRCAKQCLDKLSFLQDGGGG